MFVKRQLLLSLVTGLVFSANLWSDRRVEAVKQPCKTCKDFVVSFEKRFKDTEKSNYAGGDTSWEEEKLGSYANSEVRLVEILDGVCRHSDYDCHRILENNEEELEVWWFKLRHKEGKSDLEQWLCFSHLDVCCPKSTFGPTCEECPGGVANPCGGRGSCEGSEEKDGSGKCSCDKGYEGDTCQSCSKGYFNDTDDDDEKLTCGACDKACKDSCSGEGADMCDECAKGYELNEEEGTCKDIDECKDEDICKEGTYCLNLQGSHKCNKCDKACEKICNGAGPAKCAECAKGYARDRAGICKDDDECEDKSLCKEGTYCENQPGSYVCKACHISCKLECLGPGAGGCVECRNGYSKENDACTDVDECSDDSNPCDSETEVCHNLVGSHICKCKEGLVKSSDGNCVTEDELPPEERPKKIKKKKKSKKGGKNKKAAKKKEREEKGEDGEAEPSARAADEKEKLENRGEMGDTGSESTTLTIVADERSEVRESVDSKPPPSLEEGPGDLAKPRDSLEQSNLGAEDNTHPEDSQTPQEDKGEEPVPQPESVSSGEVPPSEQPVANASKRERTVEDEKDNVLDGVKVTSQDGREKKDEQLSGEMRDEL